jgi:hypothetical protein
MDVLDRSLAGDRAPREVEEASEKNSDDGEERQRKRGRLLGLT